jgi:SPFH domain / Band 7 family
MNGMQILALVVFSETWPMHTAIDFIIKNKEWLFSGIGVFVISGTGWLIRRVLYPATSHSAVSSKPQNTKKSDYSGPVEVQGIPPEWQGIRPANSKYISMTEKRDSVPLGLQSFSFEYGVDGHAAPLTLRNKSVRAEIGFTCRIVNPYKALFAANDYALNLLSPKFLTLARNVLEANSLSDLRAKRVEIGEEIKNALSQHFEELGVRLESVTIGAVERIEQT